MQALRGRLDGRAPEEIRELEIERSENSCLLRKYVKIEDTKRFSTCLVIYHALEIKKPSPSQPARGIFSVQTNDRSLQPLLEKIFRKSRALSLEQLSIVPKKAVWSVKLDVFVITDEGGALELATEGISEVLSSLTLPPVRLFFGHEQVATVRKPLPTLFRPRSLTISFLENGAVYDPLEHEAENSAGTVQICASSEKEVVYMVFAGCVEMDALLREIPNAISILSKPNGPRES